MCQPIVKFGGDVIGVAECINKLSDCSRFTKEDEDVFQKYLTFCGIGIQNAQLFEMSVLEYKHNQVNCFHYFFNLNSLIHLNFIVAFNTCSYNL